MRAAQVTGLFSLLGDLRVIRGLAERAGDRLSNSVGKPGIRWWWQMETCEPLAIAVAGSPDHQIPRPRDDGVVVRRLRRSRPIRRLCLRHRASQGAELGTGAGWVDLLNRRREVLEVMLIMRRRPQFTLAQDERS